MGSIHVAKKPSSKQKSDKNKAKSKAQAEATPKKTIGRPKLDKRKVRTSEAPNQAARRQSLDEKKIEVKKRIFLQEFRKHGLKGKAAEAAGWKTSTLNYHLDNDPEFVEAMEEAYEASCDALEAEARRRAVQGDKDLVVQSGKVIYMQDPETGEYIRDPLTGDPIPVVKTVRSDRLMETLLKAKRPEQFRENVKVDHAVTGGVLLVGAPGLASPEGRAKGLTWEEEAAQQQAKYRGERILPSEKVIDGQAVEVRP